MLIIKFIFYVVNVFEDEVVDVFVNEYVVKVCEYVVSEGVEVIVVCVCIEFEIVEFEGEEKVMFFEELGIE